MKTDQNLKEAFAGESQANRKYLAFAKKADEEGYTSVAKLFRAASEAEAIHAYSELKAMGGIKTTAENLQTAIDGETYEFTVMYPGFIRDAEEEAANQAKERFLAVKPRVHAEHGKAFALEKEDLNISYAQCADISRKQRSDKCPICGAMARHLKM